MIRSDAINGEIIRLAREKSCRSLCWSSPVPDAPALLSDRSIRILLVQLLQNEEEILGYLVSGMQAWSLREQERFEEEALFLSAALNAVIGNMRLEEANNAILRMAEHDYLTGLYNRRGFLRELERMLKLPQMQDRVLTLFSMDMDRLKYINDVYGHQEGDYAIQSLAHALFSETEGTGICAWYGGDEFAFAFLSETSLLPELEAIRHRIETRAQTLRHKKISDFRKPRCVLLPCPGSSVHGPDPG